MIRLGGRDQMVVDRPYFERVVGKAILFRATERIVHQQSFGGYRANIVTYTLALLSNATTQRINFDRIWREQALTEDLRETIAALSHEVYRIITKPPNGRNITEWCKDARCWESVLRDASREPLARISNELLGASETRNEQKRTISSLPSDYVENLKRLVKVSPAGWKMLADWAAETESIDPHERQLALRLGRAIERGSNIKDADAERAVAILDQASSLGFAIEGGALETVQDG